MKKLYILVYCSFAVLTANAGDVDEMLQLESLFNLDIETVAVTNNRIEESVVATKVSNEKAPEAVAEVVSVSPLSESEIGLELIAAKQEVARLKDIVNRILVANRCERTEMLYNMGCVYRSAGYKEKAEESFLDALEINPDDAAIHYNLGILYDEDLKMPAKAHKHYKIFLKLAPNDKDAGKVYEWMTALE